MMCWLLMLWVCLPLFAQAEETAAAEGASGRVNRALLVGCDRFLSQQDTSPSSRNNVLRLAEALAEGSNDFAALTSVPDGLASTGELAAHILDTFSEADADDMSLFYLSTHGVWEDGMDSGEMTLLLSDGTVESGVMAYQLKTMFDQIAGTKVLLMDACHAGAMLGKGVAESLQNVFTGEEYIVLCSSSGAQKSWYWTGDIDGERLAGAGYFSGALIQAISAQGSYGADDNRDGVITLTELKRYLMNYHGASTVRAYPEESEYPLLSYDIQGYSGRSRAGHIEGVSFENDVLSATDPTLYFSFNVVRRVQVAYQIVYHRQGRWDFDNAQLIYDNNGEFSSWPRAGKTLPLGLTERAITLDRQDAEDSGYVLLQLLTIDRGTPSVAASRLICVPPASGNPELNVVSPFYFVPEDGGELTFNVQHRFPCEMTITVETLEGETVRRLCSREPTRPEMLDPMATSFTWDGRTGEGELAPEGMYRIRVKAYVGAERYEYLSEPIWLLGLWG